MPGADGLAGLADAVVVQAAAGTNQRLVRGGGGFEEPPA